MEPRFLAYEYTITRGMIDYKKLPNGRYDAVINDNDIKGGEKTLRIDFTRSGEEFHYEGSSVNDEWIENMPATGIFNNMGNNDMCEGFHKSQAIRVKLNSISNKTR
ncbi:hypothetical protein RMCBS344292_01290 [Rhizopus microsporus]|nr:hypothetical protein RMCBS344292_01290 [Rhizopus microsporus]